jgi:hypothetical protein
MKLFFTSLFLLSFISLTIGQVDLESRHLQMLEEFGENNHSSDLFNSSPLPIDVNWTSIATAPNFFGRAIGGAIGDYIYVFGGQNSVGNAFAYHVPTGAWVSSTPSPNPGYNSSFCVAKGELYKLSGTGPSGIFEKFTPDGNGGGTWTTLTPTGTTLMNAQSQMTSDGNYIYLHSSDYATPASSFFARYDLLTNSWQALTASSLIKRYPGLAYHNGFVYLIGGLIPAGQDPTACARYEIATGTWTAIAQLPEAANFSKWTVTTVNDYIAVASSGGGYSTYPINDKVFYYDPVTNTWAQDGAVATPRALGLSFFDPQQQKLFFGGGNDGTSSTAYQNTSWFGSEGFIPVELTAFTADVIGRNVNLNWQTATEINSSSFEVERSSNQTWFTAGSVKAAGTSTEELNYSFTDTKLDAGIYQYRLKIIDFDGTFEYSNIIEIEISTPEVFALSQNYPNPFNPATRIDYSIPVDADVSIELFDITGQKISTLISKEHTAGYYSIDVSSNNLQLTSGLYIYKIVAVDLTSGANFVNAKKMMLLK